MSLILQCSGASDDRESARVHFDYALFTEILHELAGTKPTATGTVEQLRGLRDSAKSLFLSLEKSVDERDVEHDMSNLTPDEEVRLLHIME